MSMYITADKRNVSSQSSGRDDSIIYRLVGARLIDQNKIELNNLGFGPGNLDPRALARNAIGTGSNLTMLKTF